MTKTRTKPTSKTHPDNLAVARGLLTHEITRRKAAEAALKQSELHYATLLHKSDTMQFKMRSLAHHILLAQEEERKEISRELHDEIAQTLAGINVHLAALTQEAAMNSKDLTKKIAVTQKLVGKSMNIVHRFARELRPTLLDDLGLIPALSSFMKDFTKRTRIPIKFTASRGVEQMNGDKRTVFYRIAQAALNNVAQHARAAHVTVKITEVQDSIRMEINDDGKSFDVDRVLFSQRHKRLGVIGMRERVAMVGGSFTIKSEAGMGTTILAQVPFTRGLAQKDKAILNGD